MNRIDPFAICKMAAPASLKKGLKLGERMGLE